MLKIGITGNIGSGKTTVCGVFEHLGIPVYHSDQKAKEFYNNQDIKDKLYTLFGAKIIKETQDVYTKKLAQIVFSNDDLLQKLNTVIHPLVLGNFEQWSKNQASQVYVLFESAIIYSCQLTHLFDKIIFVDAPLPLIIERVMQRDKINSEEVEKRLNRQSVVNKEFTKKDYIFIRR
jgi:dephospho-CoA kinase